MKLLRYLLLLTVLGATIASCTEESYTPHNEDDPIIVPPKPPKP